MAFLVVWFGLGFLFELGPWFHVLGHIDDGIQLCHVQQGLLQVEQDNQEVSSLVMPSR